VIEKGFSEGEKLDFHILTVFVPISHGTEVMKVTECGFHSMTPLINCHVITNLYDILSSMGIKYILNFFFPIHQSVLIVWLGIHIYI